MACFGLGMGNMWLIGKRSVAWYCIGKLFVTFWHFSKDSSTGHNWINMSYLSFLCISISVVPSGNSSLCLRVEHCISKLQVVEVFHRRNGLNPCRQHEVIFTWFTRYSFQFANCIGFISQTSSWWNSKLRFSQRCCQIVRSDIWVTKSQLLTGRVAQNPLHYLQLISWEH